MMKRVSWKMALVLWVVFCLFPVAVAGGSERGLAWRGMHVDVSRHFFEMPVLCKLMDRMAPVGAWKLSVTRA